MGRGCARRFPLLSARERKHRRIDGRGAARGASQSREPCDSLCRAGAPAASRRRSFRPCLGKRRHGGVRRRLGIHAAVRGPRAQGPRRRRADHRGDRPRVRRCSASPTTTAAACSSSAATRSCSGSTATATRRARARAAVLMRRVLREVGQDQAARRAHHAAHVAGRAFRRLPLLRRRHVASRAAAGRTRVEPAGRDAARGGRGRDRRQRRDRRCTSSARCLGDAKEPGRLLLREPPGEFDEDAAASAAADGAGSGRALPARVRARAPSPADGAARAPAGHGRVHPIRGSRRADRDPGKDVAADALQQSADAGRASRRRAGRLVPRLRRRRRRREADPHRRRAEGDRQRRGADAARAARRSCKASCRCRFTSA